MPVSFLLAVPVASTLAVGVLAKPLLGVATLLALVWTVAVVVLDIGRSSG